MPRHPEPCSCTLVSLKHGHQTQPEREMSPLEKTIAMMVQEHLARPFRERLIVRTKPRARFTFHAHVLAAGPSAGKVEVQTSIKLRNMQEIETTLRMAQAVRELCIGSTHATAIREA